MPKYINKINDLAQISLSPEGGLCLTFVDPAYARSEAIIFDRKDASLHAVLHEAAHFIGHVSADMARLVPDRDEILLRAPRINGTPLNLKTRLSVN